MECKHESTIGEIKIDIALLQQDQQHQTEILSRIEKKLEATHEAIVGNGKVGIRTEVAVSRDKIARLEKLILFAVLTVLGIHLKSIFV